MATRAEQDVRSSARFTFPRSAKIPITSRRNFLSASVKIFTPGSGLSFTQKLVNLCVLKTLKALIKPIFIGFCNYSGNVLFLDVVRNCKTFSTRLI